MATLVVMLKVWTTRHTEWDEIDLESLNLPHEKMHGSRSGIFEVHIYTLGPTREETCIMEERIDLNEVVQVPKSDVSEGLYYRMENGLHRLPMVAPPLFGVYDCRLSVQSFPLPSRHEISRRSDLSKVVTAGDSRSEDSGSSHYAAGSNASTTDGRDTWTEGRQGAKMYNFLERRGDIRRLTASHRGLQELLDRRRQLHSYLLNMLQAKRNRMEQIKKLKKLRRGSKEWSNRAEEVRKKLQRITTEYGDSRKAKYENLQALDTANSRIKVTSRPLVVYTRPFKSRGRLFGIHSQLVARRCHLVSAIATVYGLRPYSYSSENPEFPEIEDMVDRQWWSAAEVTSSTPLVERFRRYRRESFDKSREKAYLGVVGMPLPTSLSHVIETGFVEWSVSQAQIESIEAVLGQVSAMVTLCSFYLDVPLRYPIHLMGSRSVACLPSSCKLTDRPPSAQEFPLFFQGTSRSSKKKLSTAFCLLAKNILQLLTSHGVKTLDKMAVLENLDALVAASRSGISAKNNEL